LAPAIRTAHQSVRRRITHADRDRMFGDDIQAALSLVRSREVLKETEGVASPLVGDVRRSEH
ncbi:MAG: hypothetical protein Q7R41_03900, partial [Phycisphaerales bacterium]|nr:hypothetical protein [Phycisphaerales bacterium]